MRPDFLYGDFGSDIERNCFRPFLQNSAVPCIHLTASDENGKEILEKLNQVEEVFDRKPFCYELKIRGLLCEAFSMILSDHQRELTKFVPANQQELERLEVMLNYLNTHFESVISLQELADQIHHVQRSVLPSVQKNDRKNNYRISGRIPGGQKLTTGTERPVLHDTDRRDGGFQ